MADLFWRNREGVLLARLVVPGSLSQDDVESIGQNLMELHENSDGKILLDLRDVEFIMSALLAKLLTLHKRCVANKTDLKLCSVRPMVMEVMNITRFNEIFEIHPSEQEALAAF